MTEILFARLDELTTGLAGSAKMLDPQTIGINGTSVVYLPDQASFGGSLALGDGLRFLTHAGPAQGQYNIAIGMGVLLANTSGYYNIGVGGGGTAGVITTGHGNIVIGWSAGFNLSTGIDNTIIGSAAGLGITTELDNTAIGVNALRFIAGGENVGIGVDVALGSLSGSQNTFLGGWAARYLNDGSTPKTTGNLGVYIGYNSHSLADGLTNEIVIGSTASGAGSNSVVLGNSSIIQTHLKGSVLIGTSTLDVSFGSKLQIKSSTIDIVNPVPLVTFNRQNSTVPSLIIGVDTGTNPTIGVNGSSAILFGGHQTGGVAFTQYMSLNNGVANVTTGFQIGGAATSGNVLRGNGTNFVSSALAFSDLTGTPSFTAPVTVTGSNASAFAVGLTGATNPALNIATNVASSVTGILIAPQIAGGSILITATSSGTNESLIFNAKGSGTIFLAGASTGGIDVGLGGGVSNFRNVATFTNTTDTTAIGAGAVQVAGGIAVTKNIYGNADVYSNNTNFLLRTKTTLANGAGASAGTITNAPSVGNPTKWISIDDNGTTRKIPAW